ncbi:hypothetical protein PMNALOAF_2471 [Methylobacterium adhaesivum]|uniref:Uncharacterized protein n=1 Tax=Methylobacterium adhaesivum TaxID=333297 RepID=A0ABT8BJJ5_9HYPH|nr:MULTISPECIES: hypothetical protein [Methylobacterium]KQT84965.1 hypothetical protein ASG51_02585 [Methylobacterium sp. Leaf465]MDN3591652.1 hypothetical protein [Methylobacterium adhaesivum]GJD31217.1 hypothetical protein PMNALOAF_2471 [Methylobacterium adhaesivum]
MNESELDDQVALLMKGILRVRRDLDPISFDAMLGAVMVEIELGLQLAEEAALERAMRPRAVGNVVKFPLPPARPGSIQKTP